MRPVVNSIECGSSNHLSDIDEVSRGFVEGGYKVF